MNTIIKNKKNEIIINKSKFINYIYIINNIEEINKYLEEAKSLYPDATHIVYAYILNNNYKSSDDGEPQNTSGKPTLELLKQNNLTNVLTITIRYFGGIKLGASGLVHAYRNSLKENLINNIKELNDAYKIKIKTTYDKINNIEYILKDDIIINKSFNEEIEIISIIKKETLDKLSNVNYEIIEKMVI